MMQGELPFIRIIKYFSVQTNVSPKASQTYFQCIIVSLLLHLFIKQNLQTLWCRNNILPCIYIALRRPRIIGMMNSILTVTDAHTHTQLMLFFIVTEFHNCMKSVCKVTGEKKFQYKCGKAGLTLNSQFKLFYLYKKKKKDEGEKAGSSEIILSFLVPELVRDWTTDISWFCSCRQAKKCWDFPCLN